MPKTELTVDEWSRQSLECLSSLSVNDLDRLAASLFRRDNATQVGAILRRVYDVAKSSSPSLLAQTSIVTWLRTYFSIESLLWRALGELYLQGFPTRVAEGTILVREFLADNTLDDCGCTDSISTRTLVSRFLRFARPRIVQTFWWRERLLVIDEVTRNTSDQLLAERTDLASSKDLNRLRSVFEGFNEDERELLNKLVCRVSDRQIAQEQQESLFGVRVRTSRILQHLARCIDHAGGLSEESWPIMRALWSEGVPVQNVEAMFSISADQVRLAYNAFLRTCAHAFAC